MCDTCETAAARVAADLDGALDADDIRAIVRAFNDASDAVIAEQASPVGPEVERIPGAENEEDGFLEAMIGGGLVTMVEMYPLGARPFILIEAEQVTDDPNPDGTVNVAVSARMGGGLSEDAALSLLHTTVTQVEARSGQ